MGAYRTRRQKTTNPRKGIETNLEATPEHDNLVASENNESPQGD